MLRSKRRLDSLRGRDLDLHLRLEQVIPELARPVAGQVQTALLDIVVHDVKAPR